MKTRYEWSTEEVKQLCGRDQTTGSYMDDFFKQLQSIDPATVEYADFSIKVK